MMTLSTPHFQTVETELAELELDSEEEDWEECWDDIFRRLAGKVKLLIQLTKEELIVRNSKI